MNDERTSWATVLAAEDDESVLGIMGTVLSNAGLRVLTASSGHEAIELSRRWRGRIDLVLADVVMPGLGGRAAVEAISATRPGIGIVFVSGYPEEELERLGGLPPGSSLLMKPFNTLDLRAAVFGALGPTRVVS